MFVKHNYLTGCPVLTVSHLVRQSFPHLEPDFFHISECTITLSLRYFNTSSIPAYMITGGVRDPRLTVKDQSALFQPRSKCCSALG